MAGSDTWLVMALIDGLVWAVSAALGGAAVCHV